METKKAFITILLVEKGKEKSNKEIEKEIFKSLSNGLRALFWKLEGFM